MTQDLAPHSALFSRLGLSTTTPNEGVYDGTAWRASGPVVDSVNPATGGVLASVREASPEDVQRTMAASRAAFKSWRKVVAPARGEVVRQIRNAIAAALPDLGALITLEMGKIASEGRGEVQEFVDVADYAVGLSRSIGGTVIPSERNKHFITEVSNPLGVVGCITAFNFPIAVRGSTSQVQGSQLISRCTVGTFLLR
jgi:aldehyde dehydrogenase family 7 protein A1